MKRIFAVILLLFALILTSAACTALQPNDRNGKDIYKEHTNDTVPDKDNIGDKNTDKNTQNDGFNGEGDVPREDAEDYVRRIIEERALDVLTAIKNYDMEKLAGTIHPDNGVRFSPYGCVDVDNDLVFTAEEVKNLATDSKTYLWGYYDGSGEPITLKFPDYYKKFVYDADFVNAEQVGYNKALGYGNSVNKNNSFEVYKNSIIVEYYFSGFEPEYEGMDWMSLRLVFEKKDNTWYLAGIIHDQWTI